MISFDLNLIFDNLKNDLFAMGQINLGNVTLIVCYIMHKNYPAMCRIGAIIMPRYY